ncbi:unnamed protein product [Nyctereutes procyonoides]|uniref:(raccoon dog) hypothetical protein n=1 Tax=Nyctereutes procyonoides TaxID=34880 RepID=A0A811Y5J4_NYCPR|nr:unnamed protein product [Nyctereutes procyonoides]
MCVCAALEHRPRGADWPGAPLDVGAGAAERRAEGQIVPAAAPRAPPQLCSPRPGLPGPRRPGRRGRGGLRGCSTPRSPPGGPMSGWRSLGKSNWIPGSLQPGSAAAETCAVRKDPRRLPLVPLASRQVTLAPPSCHHSEIHLVADLREEK